MSFGGVKAEQKSKAEESNVALYTWEEFLNLVSSSWLLEKKMYIKQIERILLVDVCDFKSNGNLKPFSLSQLQSAPDRYYSPQ